MSLAGCGVVMGSGPSALPWASRHQLSQIMLCWDFLRSYVRAGSHFCLPWDVQDQDWPEHTGFYSQGMSPVQHKMVTALSLCWLDLWASTGLGGCGLPHTLLPWADTEVVPEGSGAPVL